MSFYLSSRLGICVMVTLILFGSIGCAMTDANRTRAEGATAGAIVGGVVGQILGGDTGSTLIGAAVGGAIGTIVGDQVAKDKADMAKKEDDLVKLAAWAEKRAADTAKFNRQLKREIASLQKTNKRLDSKLLAASERKRLMIARNTRADLLRHQTNEQIDQVNHDLAFLQGELDLAKTRSLSQGGDTQSQQSQSESLQLVVNQKTSLDKEREALARAVEQLQLVDTRRD